MNLLSSIGLLLFGATLNLVTIYSMQQSNQLRPFWSPYLWGIALTIVPVQLCIVIASRNERLPIDIGVAVTIAFVLLGSALIVQGFDAARTISTWEWLGYGITVTGVLIVGIAKQYAS